MKPKVYIETSVISYITAWRSRDLVIAGNQETSREWWERREDFDIYISQFVLDEATSGNSEASAQRLSLLTSVPELEIVPEIAKIADALISSASLPEKARIDALHIAVAAWHGVDYLLTWNCKHIANPSLKSKIEETIRTLGLEPPVICTPQELIEV